ncbi:MAG: RHS repeat-associated core domain-containing protein, partial [Acidobacteriia bacterium]|nr:RHS repeat-associated core domain-containing protein [Terriglobia bacterium]
YNTSNELTSTPTTSYTYDNNGNTKTKSDGTQYNWDFENRLASVVLPGAGGTVSFKYDGFGRRVQKSFVQGANTTTTDYVYDFVNLLEEVDQSGNVLARYTQGPLVDEPLAELRSGTTSYYEQDSLGTVTSLSTSAGALANTYTYDSFGKLTASSGTIFNPLAYSGREVDSETGIYYHRARYYDQNIGRFFSEDPIRFRGGVNFYRYVANNPVSLTDPSGLKVSKCCRTTQVNWFVDFLSGVTGFKHCFIKTDTKTAGMGPVGGGPLPACPLYAQTQVRDHSSESGADCQEIPNVDESCVNRELQIGASTGRWTLTNQCNSFVYGVLYKCRTCKKSDFDPITYGYATKCGV